MRKIYIAGNWKMNKNKAESLAFIDELLNFNLTFKNNQIEQIICPASLYLDSLQNLSKNSVCKIGAQNCSEQNNGAFTGEISVDMLKDLSLNYCIIGHSERRQFFFESDQLIREKYLKLKANDICAIICIGENLLERENDKTFDVINTQLSGIFKDIKLSTDFNFIIAYEPVWAIGTGKTASPEMAQEVHHYIRNWFKNHFDTNIAELIPILYGGSVKPDNLKALLSQNDIDGGLIGGASLDIETYIKMLNIAGEI